MSDERVRITCYTDPVCTWCWGSEPVFRKIETHYGDRVAFDFVMGGLIRDYRDLLRENDDDAARFNAEIAHEWKESCSKHGMPVDSENFHLFSPELPSTYPQNMACEAARLVAPSKAAEFLYRMRLATMAHARVTSEESVQLEIARACHIDEGDFLYRMNNGDAERAFIEDRERTETIGGQLPTFVISWGGRDIALTGYRSFEIFSTLIASLTEDEIHPVTPELSFDNVLAYMDDHPVMTIAELAAAYDFDTKAEALSYVQPLFDDGALELEPAGNGFTIEKPRR
jgi:protein-disulfide isomerase-like protein with CxxC motif